MTSYPIESLANLADGEDGAVAIGPFGSRMKANIYVPQGVPVLRGTNIASGRGFKGDWVYVTQEFAQTVPNCIAREGDLVFPHRGSIGEVALVEGNIADCVISSSMMKFRADKQKADSRFIFYYFKSRAGRDEILRYASQVGTPGIGQPLTSLRQFRVPLPSLPEQTAIADVLSSMDDKIALNRRMNETVNSLARALFRDWFVEFGPTRAKDNGQSSYLPERVWDLFPDKLENDIPAGWRSVRLGQVTAELRRGITPAYAAATGVRVLNQKCIRNGEVDVGPSRRHDPEQRSVEGRTLEVGDILVNSTGVGTLGRAAQLLQIDELTVVDTHVTVVRADKAKISPHYLGFNLTGREAEIETLAEGSTGQTELPRARISALPLLLPSSPAQEEFASIVRPLLAKRMSNVQEIRTLESMRDLLLPKLMSGALKVSTS